MTDAGRRGVSASARNALARSTSCRSSVRSASSVIASSSLRLSQPLDRVADHGHQLRSLVHTSAAPAGSARGSDAEMQRRQRIGLGRAALEHQRNVARVAKSDPVPVSYAPLVHIIIPTNRVYPAAAGTGITYEPMPTQGGRSRWPSSHGSTGPTRGSLRELI